MKANKIARIYRNPIYLAKEYKKIIDSGEVKNQAELAKIKGISRARVTQILNLLKLDFRIIQDLENLGDTLESKIVTERMLRPYANKSLQ
jgi:DNA repair protein RadC